MEYVKRIDEKGNAYTKRLIHDSGNYDKVTVAPEYGPISPEKQLECRRNLEYDDWIRRGGDGEPITKEEYDTFGIKWYFNKYDEKCRIN